jgi:peptidoglycan hydrolase CwlO-like protein
MNYAFYYNIVTILIGYVVMLSTGFLMNNFVRKNLRGATNTQAKTLQVQKQLTRILAIQVRYLRATILKLNAKIDKTSRELKIKNLF